MAFFNKSFGNCFLRKRGKYTFLTEWNYVDSTYLYTHGLHLVTCVKPAKSLEVLANKTQNNLNHGEQIKQTEAIIRQLAL